MPKQPGKMPIKIKLAAVLFLAIFTAQSAYELRRESCTADEVVHLPAGFSYLKARDFRLNPEHPPLQKVLCALPLLWLRPKMDFNDPNWGSPVHQEAFGYDFLYANNADQLLTWGRWPTILLGIILGFFVFQWARQLYGNTAGLFALGLFSFSPNFLAHSHLVTTDLGVCAFLTGGFYFLWHYVNSGKRNSYYACTVLLGMSLAAKYSALVFFPFALVLLWIFGGSRLEERNPRTAPTEASFNLSWRPDRRKILDCLVAVVIALVVIQLSYLGSLDFSLYFRGLTQVNKNIPADALRYLHGHLKAGGWWYYFLVVFAVKATAPFLILVLARLLTIFRNWRREIPSLAFFALPTVLYFVVLSLTANQFGVRYLLPVFPFLMIFSSGLLTMTVNRQRDQWALWALLAWHIASSAAAFPHHLSYFNELVGGPAHGMDWLDDSNVDWGHELKSAKRFMDQHGIDRVTIYTFSLFDNPSYYGIHGTRPDSQQWTQIVTSPHPAPGFYIVSAHWLAIQKAIGIDWMKRYPVVGNLGYSMFVFRIS